ncbi:hypothetical protein FNV43_RR08821 [Rhamnella rubrinervis]|uniref:GTP-binding nuclear protein n=1 Tax=Rhamnella rubrinervis TaxID=2594499 RepID=A0A8K0H8W9_9ROSA|nr:hypothetical protein FNV43_RR08821 [Rhamnella rubrinervis]
MIGAGKIKQYSNVLDKPLISKGKQSLHTDLCLQVDDIAELERRKTIRLEDGGYVVGARVLELLCHWDMITFVKRHLTGEFEKKYESTTVLKYILLTASPIVGKSVSAAGTRLIISIHGQCAILMFDVTACLTYKNAPTWHRDLCRVYENIPIVLCGNKVDEKNNQVKAKQVTFHRKKGKLRIRLYFQIYRS